jgi:hypothetical protein
MLAALPARTSPGLDPMVPLFSSLFSASSALRSPRSLIADFCAHPHQPNHFPLFPHSVNIAHARTPANSSPSILYFTTSAYPRSGGTYPCRRPRPHSTPRAKLIPSPPTTPLNATFASPLANAHPKALRSNLSRLDATLTKNKGSLTKPNAVALLATLCSPLATHFPHQSATLCLRGTYDPL